MTPVYRALFVKYILFVLSILQIVLLCFILKIIQIRVCVASPRCRALGYVSRGWVGLPPDFHWAKNSDEPQDSEFSQQRLRELLESSLRSPEDNLPEAPPIPGIRYIFVRQLNCSFGYTYDFEFKPKSQ